MPYKPLTHEQIHTGMSSVETNTKWADLHNFRSRGGLTVAVPFKVCVKNLPSLHTVAALGKLRNYVFGSYRSYRFKGNDELPVDSLWRVTVKHNTEEDKPIKPLYVRGNYTGFFGCRTVSFVGTEPVTEPTETLPEPPPFNCFGCCDGELATVLGTVQDEDEEPIAGAIVQIFQWGAVVAAPPVNGGGIWRAEILPGYYTIRIQVPGYPIYSTPMIVTGSGPVVHTLYPAEYGKYLRAGVKLVVVYPPEAGLFTQEEQPPAPTINGIPIPITSWITPPILGGATASYALSYETMEAIYGAQEPGIDTYDFVISTNFYAMASVIVYDINDLPLYIHNDMLEPAFQLPET